MLSTPRAGSRFDEKLLELSSQIDAFEQYSHAHDLQVAGIADSIAAKLHISYNYRFVLKKAALLHDINEITMNHEYISVTRELSDVERIDLHPQTVIS